MFICFTVTSILVTLLLAVLGWKGPTHLVVGYEVAGSEVTRTCLRALGPVGMWEVEEKSVWRQKLVRGEKCPRL